MRNEIEELCRQLTATPTHKEKKIIAIDMLELLEHINNHPPEDLAQLNSIILNQRQYDLVIVE